MKLSTISAIVVGTLALSNFAFAGDVQSCTSIKNAKKRLSCFDKAVAEQKSDASTKAAAASKDVQQPAATPDSNPYLPERLKVTTQPSSGK